MTSSSITAIAALILGAALCIMNWLTLFFSWKEKRFISAVPVMGAALLGFGLLYFPATRPFAWVGIIVDYRK